MDNRAMFQLTYGLFVLTAKEGEKDNGCIINTAIQVTTTPNRIAMAVNKQNLTHDMVKNTGVFNISILTEKTGFDTFQNFGFQSGRDVDKMEKVTISRSENGIVYLPEVANAYISGKVVETVDLGTHTLFVADVTDMEMLGDDPSVTYSYYHAHIKPQPEKPQVAEKKVGYVCKICGYIYEGDPLPEDFICPICKHGAADFEKL